MLVLHNRYARIAYLITSYIINRLINIKYSFNKFGGTDSRPRLAAYNIMNK